MARVFLPRLKFRESPNQSQRIHGNDAVDLIVVHTPEGPYQAMVDYTCRPTGRRVSYHGILKEDGSEFTQTVQWSHKAWHVGPHNSRSEGISWAGWAATKKARSPGGRVLARIVAFRLKERGLPPVWRRTGGVGGGFCRHADLQTDRKDPMSLPQWLIFVAMVKAEYRFGKFRKSWGHE